MNTEPMTSPFPSKKYLCRYHFINNWLKSSKIAVNQAPVEAKRQDIFASCTNLKMNRIMIKFNERGKICWMKINPKFEELNQDETKLNTKSWRK